MEFLFTILSITLASLSYGQNCDDLTKKELLTLENLVKNDVENWSNNVHDSLTVLFWKVFPLRDCKHEIAIKTDSGKFKFDLISEIRRRTMGGFAGSYPFAESWKFELNENELIAKVKSIIEQDTTLQITNYEFPTEKDRYWLNISIKRPNSNEIIHFWIRESSIALVSYSNENGVESKLINKDFWFGENNQRIKEFELLIIEKIKKS